MFEFGYCTNVHPGESLIDVKSTLNAHAVPLKTIVSPNSELAIGLWLNEQSSAELLDGKKLDAFAGWLKQRGLKPKTMNGFPQVNFHQSVVKRLVYEPTWADPKRLEYSQRLATIQAALLDASQEGTISTLPLGWSCQTDPQEFKSRCRGNLLAFSRFAESLENHRGFHCRLCLEAEPGCYLGSSADMQDYFVELRESCSKGERELLQRYLGVCHDICHAAVMFEDQQRVFDEYQRLDINVAKVQVSSALVADFRVGSSEQLLEMRKELTNFVEPRYLHQTMIDGDMFFEDLPQAIALGLFFGEWRVHFHVPIFARELKNGLKTTQYEIGRCLELLWPRRHEIDWEIETYAWSVLPGNMVSTSLIEGLTSEFEWFRSLISSHDSK